jgi:DNA-binding MarR family transcriptional regulator
MVSSTQKIIKETVMTMEPQMETSRNASPTDASMGVDPALIALLGMLWEAHTASPIKPWSLAKISKRAGLSMSALLRHMNRLDDAGLATTVQRDEGNPAAALTDAGRELCAEIFSD